MNVEIKHTFEYGNRPRWKMTMSLPIDARNQIRLSFIRKQIDAYIHDMHDKLKNKYKDISAITGGITQHNDSVAYYFADVVVLQDSSEMADILKEVANIYYRIEEIRNKGITDPVIAAIAKSIDYLEQQVGHDNGGA